MALVPQRAGAGPERGRRRGSRSRGRSNFRASARTATPPRVLALDRSTGAIVWQWSAPGGINGWPAVAGDLVVIPVGLASPARLVGLWLPPA